MQTTDDPLRIAVVGAGPVGLALALLAAARLPAARITLFDARAAEADVAADARTLALSLGSIQLLQRLGVWPAAAAEPIREVHVSQVASGPLPARPVRIRAIDEGVPQLGAVLGYGALLAPLQRAWLQACADAPQRCAMRFSAPVAGLKGVADGVEVDAGIAETFDLAVIAEGSVFADRARKPLSFGYRQRAWVGQVRLDGARRGLAIERFTAAGPLALLPLPPAADGTLVAALVWCVATDDDPVAESGDAARLSMLGSLLPADAGRVVGVSPLKAFDLGLNAELRLVRGRTVRIGHAAQTLHPVAGQGLNLGLRDVYGLVQALRDDQAPLARRLLRVECSRAVDRWGTLAWTDLLARSFSWRGAAPAALRTAALGALDLAGPLKSRLARQMMFGPR